MTTALTTGQLMWLHSELGTLVTDDVLQAKYAALSSVRDVAVEVLRERRAGYLEKPLNVNVNGVASVNYTANVQAIERRLTALALLGDDPSMGPLIDLTPEETLQVIPLRRTRGR